MNVLVTRPEEDAAETAGHLVALGHNPVLSPVIRIQFLDGPDLALVDVAALLATSVNGVRALVRRTQARNIRLLAVGARTATEARSHGFAQTDSADGNARTLADHVSRVLTPDSRLLHATSRGAPGTLAAALIARGYSVDVVPLYETVAVTAFPAETLHLLQHKRLDAVLFFSGRTAEVFRNCIIGAGLAPVCEDLRAFCISAAAASALSPLPFRAIVTAPRPNQEALLSSLT